MGYILYMIDTKSKEFRQLKTSIFLTFGVIGGDLQDCSDAAGDDALDNEQAIECCLDADHMKNYAKDPESDALVARLIKEHGYNKVLKFLTKHIHLV